nr:MAG TPA: DNA repair protein-like protein [Caudoviricetes sp.]
MEDAISIYESLARPPKDALREIQAGRLKGKTDINPQWRYKAMTEKFGLVGIGWKYEIQKLWIEQGAKDEKLAFAQVAVLVKDGDVWSEPIVGIGGSKLVAIEKGAPVSNDEGYKMAVTDAFSTALKMLGVAADIYAGRWDGSKYREPVGIPAEVQKVQGMFNGEIVEPKLAFKPKGGETTPVEKREIANLLSSKGADGKAIFSKDEMKAYSDMRKDKTAGELIEIIKVELQNRVSMKTAQEKLDIF